MWPGERERRRSRLWSSVGFLWLWPTLKLISFSHVLFLGPSEALPNCIPWESHQQFQWPRLMALCGSQSLPGKYFHFLCSVSSWRACHAMLPLLHSSNFCILQVTCWITQYSKWHQSALIPSLPEVKVGILSVSSQPGLPGIVLFFILA